MHNFKNLLLAAAAVAFVAAGVSAVPVPAKPAHAVAHVYCDAYANEPFIQTVNGARQIWGSAVFECRRDIGYQYWPPEQHKRVQTQVYDNGWKNAGTPASSTEKTTWDTLTDKTGCSLSHGNRRWRVEAYVGWRDNGEWRTMYHRTPSQYFVC